MFTKEEELYEHANWVKKSEQEVQLGYKLIKVVYAVNFLGVLYLLYLLLKY